MEDDDLEYDITFPSPGIADVEFSDRKEPVVILLGWLGCQEKHISKYAQIYDERGCITIRYTSPRNLVFFQPQKLRDISCKILDLLKDYSIDENPILFHIFSNNGSYVYSSIVKVLTSGDERYKNLNVCGVVIDSAPGKPRCMNAAKAFGSSLKVNPIVRCFMVFGMFLYLTVHGFFATMRSWFQPVFRMNDRHFLFEHMAEDPTRWPMLFLYSKSDKLVSYYDIEDMMSARKKLGVHVDHVRWEDTEHVSHLRKHLQPYVEACENFLYFCLGMEQAEGAVDEGTFETEEDYLLSKKE